MITRKCDACKSSINITDNNYTNVILYDKKYYHIECFIDMCKSKMSNKKCNQEKWNYALNNISTLQHDTENMLKQQIIKDKIYKHMLDFYRVNVIPSTIFEKLEDVYNGRRKGMSIGIPPEDILDMWIRKKDYLTKVRIQNEMKNKKMEVQQLILYDISILINKYDSYLNWKEKNKIIEAQSSANNNSSLVYNIDLQAMGRKNNIKSNENNGNSGEEIDDILNDLFD